MRILYVGNFRPTHSTETHIALTLEDLGHEVTRIQEQQTGEFDPQQAAGHDLMLWTRTWSGFVTEEHLEALRALQVPSVTYHLDLYVGIGRESAMATDPFWHTDYVFTTDKDPKSLAVFKRLGINHHWLPAGVFKPECYEGDKLDLPMPQVAFVGSYYNYHLEWPYRVQLIDFLRDIYRDSFKLYGNSRQTTVRNAALNGLFANVPIIVGDSLCKNFTHEWYWSDRVYETTGRGGFIIHPYIEGLETQFVEGEEIVFYEYGNFGELRAAIEYYLTHPIEREQIRAAGMARTLRDHTYHNRMKELLEVVHG